MDATAGAEFNDNINLAEHGRQRDIILGGQIGLQASYPITKLNSLNMKLGLGYRKYLFHPEADTQVVLISPDSALSFDVFIGDFRINFHDQFSYQQDPIDVGTVSNSASFGRFENTAGVTVDWDLNDVVLTLGYDHYNFWSFDNEFNYLNRDAEIVSARVAFVVSPTIRAGVEATASTSDYEEKFQSDSYGFRAGPFAEVRLSENLALDARGGFQYTDYLGNGLNGDREDLIGYYATGAVTHRVNRYLTHSITLGKDNLEGLTSNFTERYFVRHNANWNFIRDWAVSTELFFEHLDDSDAFFREASNRWGGAISLSRTLTKKLNMTLGYRYTQKDSELADRDYYQNRVTLDLNYKF
jgi:hypothetical protein